MNSFQKKLIFVIYFLVIGFWFGSLAYFKNGLNFSIFPAPLVWFLGGLVSYYFFAIDRLIDLLFVHRETADSQSVYKLLQKGQYFLVWRLANRENNRQMRLNLRSALFQVILILLAVFVVTSTNSLFGQGLIFGLSLKLLLDEWSDYLTQPDYLRSWLFWQVKREVSLKETKIYLYVMTGVFLLLSWFLV